MAHAGNNEDPEGLLDAVIESLAASSDSFEKGEKKYALLARDSKPSVMERYREDEQTKRNGSFLFRCSGLSLDHKSHSSLQSGSSRKQAEAHAASLLARKQSISVTYAEQLPKHTSCLLEHLLESLSVLIHCRLRNYAIFLARHGLSMAQDQGDQPEGVVNIEQKINSLLETGKHLFVRHMGVSFRRANKVDDVHLEASLLLELERPNRAKREIEVKLTCPGTLQASLRKADQQSTPALESLVIDLDTHFLLNEMIQEASSVVAVLVEAANTSSIIPASKLPRSASFLSMPPPPDRKGFSAEEPPRPTDDDDPEAAADGVFIDEDEEKATVSPRLSALCAPPKSIPSLELVTDDEEERILASLSPDECESIVDEVFSDIDESILHVSPPPRKKQRMDVGASG